MDEVDLQIEWVKAQASLELLIEELPKIENDRRALMRSEIGWQIVHIASHRSSAWELSGQLEQRLSALDVDDPLRSRFEDELERQQAVVREQDELMAERLAAGGFADEGEARRVRLERERVQELASKIAEYEERYRAALARCARIDEALDERGQ